MAIQWEREIVEVLGEKGLITDETIRNKLSKDYFWYSPVLNKRLKDKMADGIVFPMNEREVSKILSCAYRNKIPVTVRGAGTGNYGQAVPLEGGIVMDLSKMNNILEIGDGFVKVQCGVRLGVLEKKLRTEGHELCIFPSTYVKATVGGFVSGGSGGIGSITWGNLWDGNVLEAVVYTMEEVPRRLVVEGDELRNYIHSYGTTGVVTELTIRTAKKVEWAQTIAQFDNLENAMIFSEQLCKNELIRKRLVSVSEWPIPSYFTPLVKYMDDESTVVLLETEEATLKMLDEQIEKCGGIMKHRIPAEKYHKSLGLSDFTWNHTTLWALKTDPTLTYLQASFKLDSYMEQIAQIKSKFPDEVYLHYEWLKSRGNLVPASLPIVCYRSEERLYEIIDYFESIGVTINDPHTFVLGHGSRADYERMCKKKMINDPLSLLNPGKIDMNLSFDGKE